MKHVSRRRLSTVVAVLVMPLASSATYYRAVELGAIPGLEHATVSAMNDRGHIVGYREVQVGTSLVYRAFLFDGTVVIDLGTLVSGATATPPVSSALGVNNADLVVGASSVLPDPRIVHAFVYSAGSMTDIGVPEGATSGTAVAVDQTGHILASANVGPRSAGFLWNAGVFTDLGSLGSSFTYPKALNNRGEVTGSSPISDFSPAHAFLYKSGRIVDLGTLGGASSEGVSINDLGQIVGKSLLADGSQHAFVFENGSMKDLGTLSPDGLPGRPSSDPLSRPSSEASSINSAGQIVGYSFGVPKRGAFIWQNARMTALSSLVLPWKGQDTVYDEISYPVAINDHGQILVDGLLLTPVETAVTPSRLVNLSVRASPGAGEQTLICGFVVSGEPKKLLLRGVGPGLLPFGVKNAAPDPEITLYRTGAVVGSNSNWSDDGMANEVSAVAARVGASPLGTDSTDAALLWTASSGSWTFHVHPPAVDGIAMAEVYDADASSAPRLVNTSCRVQVGTGEAIAIGGFVISGDTLCTVLIRAAGPSLEGSGVKNWLADPRITLYHRSNVLAENNDWSDDPRIQPISSSVGAFPFTAGSKDAALLVRLAPGAYTVHVSGDSGTTGVSLIEVYEVNSL